MTTDPYVPSLSMMRAAWRSYVPDETGEGRTDAEFDRFVAKVKADALREAAQQVEEFASVPTVGDSAYFHGARYGQRRVADWLNYRADRIEEEA